MIIIHNDLISNKLRNLETLSINTCRLHGSPKSSSATMSPLHRVQNLDLMDDIPLPLPFPKDNHTNSPVSITPIMDYQTMTPSRRQLHHTQSQHSDLASSNIKTTNCSKSGTSSQPTQSTAQKPETTLKHRWHDCPELHKAMDGVTYIADHTKKEEESTKVSIFLLIKLFS